MDSKKGGVLLGETPTTIKGLEKARLLDREIERVDWVLFGQTIKRGGGDSTTLREGKATTTGGKIASITPRT